ncbi:unnamed protein product [Urochloa humidicola]
MKYLKYPSFFSFFLLLLFFSLLLFSLFLIHLSRGLLPSLQLSHLLSPPAPPHALAAGPLPMLLPPARLPASPAPASARLPFSCRGPPPLLPSPGRLPCSRRRRASPAPAPARLPFSRRQPASPSPAAGRLPCSVAGGCLSRFPQLAVGRLRPPRQRPRTRCTSCPGGHRFWRLRQGEREGANGCTQGIPGLERLRVRRSCGERHFLAPSDAKRSRERETGGAEGGAVLIFCVW